MRHALNFEAFLFVLMAFAARGGVQLVGACDRVSCAVGIWGLWFWNAFYRTNM